MKVAIYVEGITEAGLVYRLIGEKYLWDWTRVRIECLNLDPINASEDLRDYGDENAPDYFLIYDSQSDTSVVSDICERYKGHRDNGFDKVVGLRDVYSENYIELYHRQMNIANVEQFINDIHKHLSELDNTGFIRVRFAVMETEAWLLALSNVFEKLDPRLDADGLLNMAGMDVNTDPQSKYFHPFTKIEDIFRAIGRTYSKHWREIKEIVLKIEQVDFERLYNSGRCQSFRDFYDAVFN